MISEERIEELWHKTYRVNPYTKGHDQIPFARAIEAECARLREELAVAQKAQALRPTQFNQTGEIT